LSSRRNVFRGAFALAALAAAGADCHFRRATKERGPWLRLEPTTPDVEPEGAAWRGLSLAVRALPEKQRVELAEAISEWVADMEAQHHPLVIDLIEEPSPPLERVRAWFLPVWNAATALDARRWELPGKKFQVSIARDGDPSKGAARVFRAWESAPERDVLLDGARFAAWPITSARLVDAGTLVGSARLAAALRARLCDPASCIGVFVDRSSLDRLDRCAEVDAIRALAERARRLAARSGADLEPEVKTLLGHVPTSEPATTVKDWLDLGKSEVLVVPRLGALARRAAFDDELRSLRVDAGLPG
jgi:hypothetical protein